MDLWYWYNRIMRFINNSIIKMSNLRTNNTVLFFVLCTVVLVVPNNLTVKNSLAEIAPPPPPPAMTEQTKKSTAKRTPLSNDKKTTKSVKQDKPAEQQKQFPLPDIVIRYKDGAKIEEYRVNGQLRYAKITPKIGPSYYLIDTNGDGTFNKRHDQLENPPIQQWLLYSW